ncbi:MAG TPA: HD domain-containing phosphohydrolase [bacterium]|nr:HD domain-containing phosphohydrolase [bacterium]
MERHAAIGNAMLRAIPSLEDIAPLARHHHERWDGAGYPDKLRGKAIPYLNRALALIDSFEAMTGAHLHRRALTHVEALHELRRCRGSQFDPTLTDVFCGAMAR